MEIKITKNFVSFSLEAEYIVVSKVIKEILLLENILDFLHVKLNLSIIVSCDTVGEIFWCYNAKSITRNNNIGVTYNFISELIQDIILNIVFGRLEEND